MTIKTILLFSTAILVAVPSFAQTSLPKNTQTQSDTKPIAPYGDNPNLLHVFAYKTQEGVLNTAEKVSEAAERGVAKVKPTVERVWNNTKTTASNTRDKVDQGAVEVAHKANQKIQDTKDILGGSNTQPIPIEQQPLSQSSNATPSAVPQAPTTQSTGGATSYAVTDL